MLNNARNARIRKPFIILPQHHRIIIIFPIIRLIYVNLFGGNSSHTHTTSFLVNLM